MIELKNVSKYYNNNGVVTLGLRNINLNFDKNEIVAIVGESGSGKSTLLNVICGVDSYEDGEIVFNGYETSYFNQEDMDTFRRTNVSFIYQNYNIIDSYTVLENVMFPLLINGVPKKEAKKRATELIEKVGLSHRIRNRGTKLSGGEKQRCVIARALATDAPILACDEPTGNLDSKTGQEIINLIKEVAQDKLVLIVSHNYEQVENIVTRTIKMADGEVLSDSNVNNNVTQELKDGDLLEEEVNKTKIVTLADISKTNLIRTPKKNIFILSVLFVLSVIGLILFGNCFRSSVEADMNAYNNYSNLLTERVIVYDKAKKSFDENIFASYESYANEFYGDDYYRITFDWMDMSVLLTKHMPYGVYNKIGNDKVDDGVFLVMPKNYGYGADTLGVLVDKEIDIISSNRIPVKVVGVGFINDGGFPLLVVSDNVLSKVKPYNNVVSNAKAKLGDDDITIYTHIDNDVSKTTLYLNTSTMPKISELRVLTKVEGFEIAIDDYDVVLNYSENYLVFPESALKKDCKELTVYTNNIKAVEKLASSNGLSILIPSQSGKSMLTISYWKFVLSICYSALIMIFLVFISYIILQKVYQSRRKDYAIMRSLGLMKPQMATILRIEVLALGLISSVLSLVGMAILGNFVNTTVIGMDLVLKPGFILLYILLMLLFDLRLANKFNKKLFKFSVTKTMKEVF